MRKKDQNDITFFAETNFRNEQKKFGIKHCDRRYHFFVIGRTGMGKTTLLENLIVSDLHKGKGLAVIDPHGDLIERLLDLVPAYRIDDVIYFNPDDLEHPLAMNMLGNVHPRFRSVFVAGVLSVFKMLYREFWGPRMEHVFRNALLTALEIPDATLFTVKNLLTDLTFRNRVIKNLKDRVLRDFWEQEFNKLDKRQRMEVISPILNKLGQYIADPMIRNIVSQKENKIRFRKVMDEKKILLANLAKGKIGEDNAALLGALLISRLQLAALSRADIPEEKREDFYLYIDECHSFLTESMASMLAEMRKYRLNLILANQHLEQLDHSIRSAILGNVGTIIVFRTGAYDADILREEFFPKFAKVDFLNLPQYQIYLRLMIGGVVSEGFSANTLPPQTLEMGNRDKIINVSRKKYSLKGFFNK